MENEKEELVTKVMSYCAQSCATLVENGIDNFDIDFGIKGETYILKFSKKEDVMIMNINNKTNEKS